MSCILALFCPLAGSKWYFNYSYTCYNTWVRVIYASFDPSLEIVSVREIFKNLYPNDPSDKNFFWVSTNMYISSYWLSYMHSKWSEKHPRGFSYILGPILPNFNWSWAGPTGRYSENSHSINQKIQKTGFFWRFLSFVEESRQMCQTLVLENESSNLHLAYRENRISDASSVLKILPVKGVLFSTSVEVRVLIPSVVRLSLVTTFPG